MEGVANYLTIALYFWMEGVAHDNGRLVNHLAVTNKRKTYERAKKKEKRKTTHSIGVSTYKTYLPGVTY